MSKNDDYIAVLAEELRLQREQILEALDTMKNVPGDIRQLKEDMYEVKGNIKVIKAVLTDHEKDFRKIKKHVKLKPA